MHSSPLFTDSMRHPHVVNTRRLRQIVLAVRGTCPPCSGNCEQGDLCPQHLATMATALTEADLNAAHTHRHAPLAPTVEHLADPADLCLDDRQLALRRALNGRRRRERPVAQAIKREAARTLDTVVLTVSGLAIVLAVLALAAKAWAMATT